MSDLQGFLINKFIRWQPKSPTVVGTSKRHIELCWAQCDQPFGYLGELLLYRVDKKEKIPPRVMVYSGGKTSNCIDNLAPSHPHEFRVQVIVKETGVPLLAERALQYYGSVDNIYRAMNNCKVTDYDGVKIKQDNDVIEVYQQDKDRNVNTAFELLTQTNEHILENGCGNCLTSETVKVDIKSTRTAATVVSFKPNDQRWLQSQWSEATWACTDSDGTSAVCFCMAVRCGYIKQVQQLLEERPPLIHVINSTNGLTPLATAVRKGDLNMVKFLISSGADVNQPSSSGQPALQQAVYAGHLDIADLLLERGAHFQTRDINGLRVEHYAVDSGILEVVVFVFDRGGDVHVRDGKGWTPLFRAVLQGASAELVRELVARGSDVTVTDAAGLTLSAAAGLLSGRRGRGRESILRAVDEHYSRDKAVANFTRLTKKISSVQSLFK